MVHIFGSMSARAISGLFHAKVGPYSQKTFLQGINWIHLPFTFYTLGKFLKSFAQQIPLSCVSPPPLSTDTRDLKLNSTQIVSIFSISVLSVF